MPGAVEKDETMVAGIIQQLVSYMEMPTDDNWPDKDDLTSHIPLLTEKLAAQLLCPSVHDTYDALPLMSLLVQKQQGNFLVPVSRAVLSQASRNYTHCSSQDMATTNNLPTQPSSTIMDVMLSQLLPNPITEVADNASKTVVLLCRTFGSSMTTYAVQTVTELWKSLLYDNSKQKKESSVIMLRYASLVVSIITKCEGDDVSCGTMDVVIKHTSLDLVLDMISTESDDDPLMKMALLDLMEELVTSRPMSSTRVEWLLSSSVIEPLLVYSGGDEAGGGPDMMLGSQALRILSGSCKLAMKDTTATFDNSKVVVAFHRSLRAFADQCHGEADRLAFIDAVSSFAFTSPDALSMILKDEVIRTTWLQFGNSQAKMKAAIILSLVRLMDPFMIQGSRTADHITTSDLSIEKKNMFLRLYRYLGCENSKSHTNAMLYNLARSPFTEIRLASYELFGVTSYIAPEELLATHQQGDFLAFVEDRDSESTKEGKEAKYQIAKSMLRRSDDLKRMPFGEVVGRLEKIVSQGPFFRQNIGWDVGMAT